MAYLHLCKMDPNVKGDAKFVGLVGSIIQSGDGYRFLPNGSGRTGSRRAYAEALDCIPAWTDGVGFVRLLTHAEYRAALSRATGDA